MTPPVTPQVAKPRVVVPPSRKPSPPELPNGTPLMFPNSTRTFVASSKNRKQNGRVRQTQWPRKAALARHNGPKWHPNQLRKRLQQQRNGWTSATVKQLIVLAVLFTAHCTRSLVTSCPVGSLRHDVSQNVLISTTIRHPLPDIEVIHFPAVRPLPSRRPVLESGRSLVAAVL